MTVLLIILSMLLGLIPAYMAKQKGHSFFWWWLYGTIIFIVAFIHAAFLDDIREDAEK